MKIFYCFLFYFSLLSNFLFAQQTKTTIEGNVLGLKEQKKIRVYEVQNFISEKNIKIFEDTISKNGSFNFEFFLEPQQTKTIIFAIERLKSHEIFIQAGENYFLTIDSVDYSKQDEFYSPLSASYPNLDIILKKDTNELNRIIWAFINQLVDFSSNNFIEMASSRNKLILDDFEKNIDSVFYTHKKENQFFKDFIDYSIAELAFNARLRGYEYFVNEYFDDKAFLYNNPAFMSFFKTLFNKYIYIVSAKISAKDLNLNIVENKNYSSLLDSLGKDKLLKNELVRDLVLIYNLNQMYFEGFLPRLSIYNMMEEISENSKFEKHKQIAKELLSQMKIHYPQIKAPELTLRENDGAITNLKDFKGMYVYLFFFTTYCNSCLAELMVLENLHKDFKDNIIFLGVSMDISFLKYHFFIQDNKFSFNILNFAKNFDIEEEWNLKIYPHAFMIDENGNIINKMAPLPSDYLGSYLNEILKKK